MTIWQLPKRLDGVMQCPQCFREFSTIYGLEKHLNVMHLYPNPPQMWRVKHDADTDLWYAEQRDDPEYVIPELGMPPS